MVCTLQEGDDFGKLALVNNAPRTTSIQLREANCCFLRVDREDFQRLVFFEMCFIVCFVCYVSCRILLSVEKNTVKFREHGKEVLLLEKSTVGK